MMILRTNSLTNYWKKNENGFRCKIYFKKKLFEGINIFFLGGGTIISLTQDINVTVLHIVDTLLDRLIAAHIQRQQHHGLAKCVSCRLHQLVLFPQVAHGGNDCENRGGWVKMILTFHLVSFFVEKLPAAS